MESNQLSNKLLEILKDLTPSVVATAKDNKPYTTFITWLTAVNPQKIRFAVNKGSKTYNNLKENPYASVEVFGEGIASSISGKTQLIKEEIEGLSFPVSVFELNVEKVVDNLFPGGNIKGSIPFEHTGDISKAKELDEIVLKALKET
ncbi:MAG: pyridoxamine 5'-phosphate oxidase [Aquificae bacterium]|nr:pyridoxamine 5'-phosphate oxidase [Aquificota bacterium]